MKLSKLKEHILKDIIASCTTSKSTRLDPQYLYKKYESQPFFEQALLSLESNGLIKNYGCDACVALRIDITPYGLSYFEDKRASNISYAKSLMLSKVSDIIVAAITSVLTYLLMQYISS